MHLVTATHGSNYQTVRSCGQAWEGHPSTSSSSAPDRHLSLTSSWLVLETFSRSPKKQVAGSYSLWQQPPTCWSMEICHSIELMLEWHNGPSNDDDDISGGNNDINSPSCSLNQLSTMFILCGAPCSLWSTAELKSCKVLLAWTESWKPHWNLCGLLFSMALMHGDAVAECADCYRNTASWESSYGTDDRRPWECCPVGAYSVSCKV